MTTAESTLHRFAVIVGVNTYESSGAPNLTYCANDAEAFYDALVHYAQYVPGEVTLFSDGGHSEARQPRYTDILSSTKEICAKATEHDSILFFFAGHGTRDERDSYLLTREFRMNVLQESAISMQKINDYFRASQAKFRMRFFDACHSGRMGIRGLPSPDVRSHFAVEAEGWATLAACGEDQLAHELPELGHGIFSYFLVKGLSGEASIDGPYVSLDNLKVYVMDKTIELTRKRGIEQTPVFSGEQAGSLVLAHLNAATVAGLPETLVHIKGFESDTLEPVPAQTPAYLEELGTLLGATHDARDYVARDQEQKMSVLSSLVQSIEAWAQAHVKAANAQHGDLAKFEISVGSTSDLPVNRKVAVYLYNSRVMTAVELEFKTEVRTRHKREPKRNLFSSVLDAPQYEEVPYQVTVPVEVREPDGYPASNVVIRFEPNGHLFPRCAMVIALIPSAFGAYWMCYFVTTNLGKGMEEKWDPATFSIRGLAAVPVVHKAPTTQLEQELNRAFAEFTSFVAESVRARQVLLANFGAGPGVSLV